ncbi:hypothetical protein SAMN05421805_10917 [Saccharopolyspora antimicrobica]|uniref:Uncharacterized protein n=1 Tax=Saccharopolyspora antimicrobica TaxID=455193 RepID=A0A1I5E506_9PSEU|nr:hypothetical protein [Saccharopolyspora antimicrobica]RKT86672.1 hypothetical protein ATL45_5050 [Saccharopolyspora antimicrobica]SFO06644.1 hypothetical protein SAMN05421805_10917 [Saccharopolyspora antimicrobica]
MSESVEESTGTDSKRPSRWRFVLTKTGFVVSALVVAVAGVAGPFAWNAVRDLTRPPLLVSAVVNNETVDDYSYAFEAVIPPERVAELGFVGDYPGTGPGVPGATKFEKLGTLVTVEGASSRNVVITDMRARILDKGPVLTGTVACVGPQGGGPTIRVGIDLDELNPTARVLDSGKFGARYFLDNAITLADGETVVFQVEARAAQARYRWVLELDAVIDGRPQTIEVQPEDGPYELTGAADGYDSVFEWSGSDYFSPVPGARTGWCVE